MLNILSKPQVFIVFRKNIIKFLKKIVDGLLFLFIKLAQLISIEDNVNIRPIRW